MQPELIIFLLMVGSFMLSCFAFKLSAGIGMVIAAIVGALAGGMGFPVAQFVEGTFAFLDTIGHSGGYDLHEVYSEFRSIGRNQPNHHPGALPAIRRCC